MTSIFSTIQFSDKGLKRIVLLAAAAFCFYLLPSNLLAQTTITYVQGNYAVPQTPQTTVNVAYTAAEAAGDLNVVVVGWNDSTAAVGSITDTRGNVYTRAVGPTIQAGVASQSIYYARNIVSALAGANTVTVTFSAAANYPDIRILEYRGADLTNPVDVTIASSGNSATSNSGSVTTTNANDLLFGANLVQTGTSGPGSGFTRRLLTAPDGDIAEDRIVTATGSYSATAPLSSGQWIMQMVAFRGAGSIVDTTPPSVTINQAVTQLDPAVASPINFTVVFSEAVTGFATGDVTVGGTAPGTKTATVTGSGPTYNVAVSGMTGPGTVITSIAAGVATDLAGNPNNASTSTDNTITYDNVPPTVTINQAAGQADPTGTTPINFTVVFSEAVTGFATGDVTVGGTAPGTKTATVTGSGSTYNVAVTGMTGSGTVVATIGASVAADLAGNPNIASTSADNTVTYNLPDTIPPTVAINQATGQADPSNALSINFTAVFSEPVTGFTNASVTLGGTAGATIAAVTGGPAIYNVAMSGMTGPGTVIASIGTGVVTDLAGNPNIASTSTDNTITYDNVAPTVAINQATSQGDPAGTTPINFTVVFSKSVTGFTNTDVTLSGTAGATTAVVTGSGTTYNVAVTGMTGPGTVVASIGAGVANDLAGNLNVASASTDNTVTYDNVAPTVAINQAVGQADPTGTAPINFTVVFSEAVTGFTNTDVTLSGTAGATTAVVTGSGSTYNVAVSGMTGSGTVIASIGAEVAADLAGNPNIASTSADNTVTYNLPDTTPPTVAINQAVGQADPSNASSINFTAAFSEPVTGFTNASVTLGGTAGATMAVVTGGPAIYNVAVSGMTGPGTVIASIGTGVVTDLAGNPNIASASTDNTITYDNVAPTATINQAAGQTDPTRTTPINFTVVFSKSVTGFINTDVTLSGTAGATTAVVTGSGTTYNVAVTGMTGSGTVVASIGAGVANDLAGNLNVASTSTDNTVTYDNVAPTVAINQAAGQADPTGTAPINFTVVFSEAVSGFTNTNVTLSGTAGATTAVVTGSGSTYNVAVSGMTASGTVLATIGAGVTTDLAGNPNIASTSADNTVTFNVPDTNPPTVAINQAVGQADPSNASSINFTAAFSEPVTGFTNASVTLGGTAGATMAVVTGGPAIYNIAVSGMSGLGTVIASIGTGVVTDLAGNPNIASTSTDNSITYDSVAPTATINQAAGQTDPTRTTPINFTVVFSKSVTGFTNTDVTLSGTAGATTAVVTGSGTTYNVAVTGMTGPGTVVASIGAGVANDLAGNLNVASTSTDNTVTYDNVAPTVAINQAAGQADPTGTAPINFTVVFSEAVSGFTNMNVTLSGTAGATTAVVTGSGSTYNVAVSGMTASGAVLATIGAGVTADLAGNPNIASTSADNTVTFNVPDTNPPTVAINQAVGQADPSNASSINFTAAFSEPVTGFTNASVTLGGTAGATMAVVTGGPAIYNIAVSGMSGLGTVIASIGAGVVTDLAGNPNIASTSTDNTITYDNVAPTVTINQAAGQTDPTGITPINFTVVFSKSVTGFTNTDVTLSGTAGATTAVVTGSGSTYNVAVSGMTTSGTVLATIGAGVATDLAGNPNVVSTSTDNTVTFNNIPAGAVAAYSFSEGSGTTTADASGNNNTGTLTNGPIWTTGSVGSAISFDGTNDYVNIGNGTSLRITGSLSIGAWIFVPSFPAGDTAIVSKKNASGTGYQLDTTAASGIRSISFKLTNSSNASVTRVGATALLPNQWYFVTGVFDAAAGTVNVYLNGQVDNGTLTGTVTATQVNSNSNVNIGRTTGGGSQFRGTIDEVRIYGRALSQGEVQTLFYSGYVPDTTPPSVTINQAATQLDPKNTSPINFTVVFSESVTGFATGDVTVTGTAPGTKTATVTGSGTTYNVAVTGMTGSGTVVASIAAGVATDLAGNPNLASTSTDNVVTFDNVPPSVAINQASGQADPTAAATINFTVVFSEAVTGFATGDVTISGSAPGTKTATVTGSGATYNVAVTGMTGPGTVIATVASSVATDLAGNFNTASTSTDDVVTYNAPDTTPPTVTINQAPGQADPVNASPINFTVVFSEPVSGFSSANVTLGGTAGATLATVTGSGPTYGIAVSGMSTSGSVVVTIGAGVVTDLAGNPNLASTSTDNQVTFDIAGPSIPIGLTATAVGSNQISLGWNGATDNIGVTGYLVERCQGAGCSNFGQIITVSGVAFNDTGLASNSSFSYRIRATDAAGNLSLYSVTVTAVTPTAPTTITYVQGNYSVPPTQQSAVTVTYSAAQTAGDLNVVVVGWNDSTATVTGVSDTRGNNYVRAVGPTIQSGVASQSIYYASNISSAIAGANTVSVTFSAPATFPDVRILEYQGADPINPVDVTVANSGSGSLASSGSVTTTNSTDLIFGSSLVQSLTTGPGSGFTTRLLTNPNSDIAEDRMVSTVGNYDASAQVSTGQWIMQMVAFRTAPSISDPVPPTAPGNLVAGANGTQIELDWTASTDNIGVTGYLVERCQGLNCATFAQIGTAASISYFDTGLVAGTNYSYRVRGTDAAGNLSAYSNIASAMTGIGISPRAVALTFTQTQQFTATGGSITWLVDGVPGGSADSGTITTSGLYTPPANVGTHIVRAMNSVQAFADATVNVVNYPGTFTRDIDTLRTGLNPNESVLTPANVNATQFGKLFNYAIDGVSDASPLYVANLNIPGKGFHNVVFVATEHDSVYAFDADGLSSSPLWNVSFIGGGTTTIPASDTDPTSNCCDLAPEVGITSTPVIDPGTGTIYVVAATKVGSGNKATYFQTLHALDITTGAEKFGGPVVVQASVAGTGDGASGGQVPFAALREGQRPALLLANGVVYFAFGGHDDYPPYHGWVYGYSAATLQQVMVHNTTPDGGGGGIWQSGDGLATDATGRIYFVTGNGSFNADTGGRNYGDSVMVINTNGTVSDYFTPYDQAVMASLDLDLGSGGVTLLPDQPGPHPHLAVTGGKNGTIYVVDRDNMGHYNPSSNSQIVQSIINIFPGGTFGTGNFKAPVYFNGTLYFSADADSIKAFQLTNGMISISPTSQTNLIPGYPGATLSISSNGITNGILWAVQRVDLDQSGQGSVGPGVLHAFDPNNLATELYNSNQAPASRDALDHSAKWSSPLVANGKVFVSTNGQLTVFGLLP